MATNLAVISDQLSQPGRFAGSAGFVMLNSGGVPITDSTLDGLNTALKTKPQVPAVGVVNSQDVVDALVALGLITQAT